MEDEGDDLFDVFDSGRGASGSGGGAALPKGPASGSKRPATAGGGSAATPVVRHAGPGGKAVAAVKSSRQTAAANVAMLELEAKEEARRAKRARKEDKEQATGGLDFVTLQGASTATANESSKDCIHKVAIPTGYDYTPMEEGMPSVMAKEYPFALDPFQREAVKCINRSESVLVSAHTSAGKTVTAEYAIATALRDKQRVIYTSPIKALSNQKYRDLQEEFEDVGLMTGDVTIAPSAACLVMTTEILRSMLYRGSEVMREVGWVIFDEVHYMRDKERGVVWEETMILLPHNVHYVFLSATIPNALEFARWIADLHMQPCHVVYTDYRPTPLVHYLFPAAADGLYLVVDEKGNFREDSFTRAMSLLSAAKPGDAGKKGRKGGQKGPSEVKRLIELAMKKNLNPVICFSFSKRDCESNAQQLKKLDFNSEAEKAQVSVIFNGAIDSLSDDDKKLPQVGAVLPFLQRGIGIHHGGLLPILKEVIEILFGEGLVKVLFATETFAMGLNMPAKTVIFTNVRKFDGKDFRWLTGGEYIQMSGRAGRRGKDTRGLVFLMCDEKMEAPVGKALLKGEADKLNSAFHLTYNMVLNLLRVEELNPEYMLERCFFQFQNQQALPAKETKLAELEGRRDSVVIEDEASVAEYYQIRQQLTHLSGEIRDVVFTPKNILPYLNRGRLVEVKSDDDDWGWGSIVNFTKKPHPSTAKSGGPSGGGGLGDMKYVYIVEVLLHCAEGSEASGVPKPCLPGATGEMLVQPVLLDLLQKVSVIRVFLPTDIRGKDARLSVLKSIKEVKRRCPDGIPVLDPQEEMKIPAKELAGAVSKYEIMEKRMFGHPVHSAKDADARLALHTQKLALIDEHKRLKREIKQAKSILQLDELKHMKRVLRRLEFCTADDVVTLKGRVACEISSGDALVLTEMIFNGIFTGLEVKQVVALVTCFVFDEKSKDPPKASEDLAAALRALQDTARRVAKVKIECKIPVNEEEYVESFRTEIMDIAFAWADGATFSEIMQKTEIYEGSIIRVMRRLEELLRQLCMAAKAIGNIELENTFASGITKIKRDIIFAASLYL